MPDFVYGLNDSIIFILMITITVAFSLLFIIMNKVFKFYRLTFKDNTTTASVASLIGIIYGVLAGFVCLYLMNNQDHAAHAALDEGSAVSNIYRESKWLNPPMQTKVQDELKKYILNVINNEWPKMAAGKNVGTTGDLIIYNMSNELISYPIHSQMDYIIVNNFAQSLNELSKYRQERIQMGGSQLSREIWEVIFLSTFLIIIINYAFRVNFKLHIFGLTAFAIMAASILFLLVTLDRPFQGEFFVQPDVLRSVLDLMNAEHKS